MATKTKTTTTRRFRPNPSVGFDATAREHGHLRNNPAVVLAVHPIHGMRAYGPFLTLTLARAWQEEEAEVSLACDWGTARGWTLHATTTEVPGHWA